jgi:hypothetical protein
MSGARSSPARYLRSLLISDQTNQLGILATPDQRLVEKRAVALFATDAIAGARDDMLALFRADRNAKLADQEALILNSVEEHLFHCCLVVANETAHHPRIVWSITPDHCWMGLGVPGSRFGQDNCDNIYRLSTIDSGCTYRITGRFAETPPCDFSICALPAQIGEGMAADVVGFIGAAMIDVAADGSFAIAVDATPTNGRRNHLTISGARTLMVRDSFADWSTERPTLLAIERTDAPPRDDYDPANAAIRAAELSRILSGFFLEKIQHGMFENGPLNTVHDPLASAARGGLVTQCATGGYYRLGDGEALILTLDRMAARYLGVQIVDMWMLSFEYRHHTSCLNHSQAVPDEDGRYRFVISASDPGVPNWLDGSGNACGCILVRWQHLPPGAQLEGSASSQVVRIEDLRAFLPAATAYIDADARSEQRRRRFADYNGRFG